MKGKPYLGVIYPRRILETFVVFSVKLGNRGWGPLKQMLKLELAAIVWVPVSDLEVAELLIGEGLMGRVDISLNQIPGGDLGLCIGLFCIGGSFSNSSRKQYQGSFGQNSFI